ncbi:MAG: MFS transporter [Acetobacter sp.]|nr:MFS transporter [Bacteroides sp.]MCM1340206.1 MFS transporter [Acetobacter sp.]MCM1432842.1 MFS transporter [Clostridiales bacterium]
MSESVLIQNDKKHIKGKEFILYLVAVFFYTMMTGAVGSYRSDYLINVLSLPNKSVTLFNTLTSVIPFILNFFIAMYIDGRKKGKGGKFRPLALLVAIPTGIFLVLSFIAPKGITGSTLMIYLVTVAVAWAVCTNFGDCVNKVAIVMTPNLKERDTVMSFRGIVSAVGNSAPLVVELVLAFLVKDKGLRYIGVASLCSVFGIITMLLGMKTVRERVTYSNERKNPLEGYADVVKNKYAWIIIISEFLKSFRGISTYMGIFLAEALLGPGKFLLFGLPTGIGTAVGMLVINFLLKKFNSKQLYIASGIYSVIANCIAFAVGYTYFKNPNNILQIIFVATLFLIGLQFGASNLLPTMFQADVLEDIELKTGGKRLDASLPFVVGIGTMISGTIASALAPIILYGDGSIIQYVQATKAIPNPIQSEHAKIMLLFFYTIVHGIMMFLAGVPYFFYKFTGKTKEDVHNAVLAQRERIDKKENIG